MRVQTYYDSSKSRVFVEQETMSRSTLHICIETENDELVIFSSIEDIEDLGKKILKEVDNYKNIMKYEKEMK